MKAGTMILAGGIAVATLAGAAPAAAQYYQGYPGYGSQGYPGYGNPGYPGYGVPNGYGYGANQQAAVNQCAAAVQQRLNGYNGARGYGYNGYQNGYGGARVLGISRVEPRSGGGLNVHGVANSGRYSGYAYNNEPQVDLTWRCKVDYRGFIADIDIAPAQRTNGVYNPGPYAPYNNDYSQYGYRRY